MAVLQTAKLKKDGSVQGVLQSVSMSEFERQKKKQRGKRKRFIKDKQRWL